MGHYASEIDPEWGENIKRSDRRRKLRKKVADVPIGAFTCDEAVPLMKLLGVHSPTARGDLSHAEMDLIETRLKQIKAEAQ